MSVSINVSSPPSAWMEHDLSQSQSQSQPPSAPVSASTFSISDSQSLSKLRQAKAHYVRAARAFLQKDYLTSVLDSQDAVNLLSSPSDLGLSLFPSRNLVETNQELERLVEKLVILRLTVVTLIYTNDSLKSPLLDQLKKVNNVSSHRQQEVSSLLNKDVTPLISTLWFETLRLCSHTSGQADSPSLDPSPDTLALAMELSSSVASAAILAALRLDDLNPTTGLGTNAARLISEWYLAAFSSSLGSLVTTDKAIATYEKVVILYSLHVLASRLQEWEYAREFVGYSSLEEPKKLLLLQQLSQAYEHITTKAERDQEAVNAAQQVYEREKARRAAAEKQAKTDQSTGSRIQDLAKGVAGFLRGQEGPRFDASKRPSKPTSNPDETSGSESGSAKRGSSYFSSHASTSSSSTSPTTSPGSSRTERADKPSQPDGKRRSSRGGSRSGKTNKLTVNGSNHVDGNSSDSSGRLERSRSKDSRLKNKQDDGYAATRANLSRYLEKKPLDRTNSRQESRSDAGAIERKPTSTLSNNLVNYLRNLFKLSNSSSSSSYVFSALVLLFVLYRFVRRPSSSLGTANGRTRTNNASVAAQEARNKLGSRNRSGNNIVGTSWMMMIWRNLFDTVKMGTQVTYL